MRLARRLERILDADVQLAAAREREPRTASRTEGFRLLELLEPEQPAEETPRLVLAARRGRELDMV